LLYNSIKKIKDKELQSYYLERYSALLDLLDSEHVYDVKEAKRELDELKVELKEDLQTQD
jgi:hypothetical protein